MSLLWEGKYDVDKKTAKHAKEFKGKVDKLQVELTLARSEEALQRQEARRLTKDLSKAH